MSDSSERSSSRYTRRIQLTLVVVVVLLVALTVMTQFVWFWLNITEFGELFIRPIYFEILAGLLLSAIVLFRLDFKNRRSLVWWAIRLVLRLIRERGLAEALPPHYIDFKVFKMTPGKFAAWQITKVVLGMLFFRNMVFGMTLYSMMHGWDVGLGTIWGIFRLPFVTPPFDMRYAGTTVIPMVPALTLVVAPILGSIGMRLLILVGATQLARVIAPSVEELGGERQQLRWRIAVVEALIALGAFWLMFNSFFPSFIDYNSRIEIGAFGALGVVCLIFAYLDWSRGKGMSVIVRRRILMRVLAVIIIILLAGSIMAVQNSVADARKVEWLGPYTVQQIAVNRYLAELDQVKEIPYNFSVAAVPASQVASYTAANQPLISNIRLWDLEGATAKLKPEIGLIPYLDFEDSDILRFKETLYWSAALKPILPSTVRAADQWYAEHFYYTEVPVGFLFLDAHNGSVIDAGKFFSQRQIYYGEGGLFADTWASYPVGRQTSDEIGGVFYSGTGGVDAPPPISWFFDATFFWSYTGRTMHLLRYRDVYDRMQILFPYFKYDFSGTPVDMLPVTDGVKTYWLMPLIVDLNTGHVPWSSGNPLRRLVGYAIIDIYNGSIQLLIMGKDYFSELFKSAYSEYVITDVPTWLRNQLRYPEELFDWRISMYNYFHVSDPATFIVGSKFYEVPPGLDTYYIMAKPPTFNSIDYVGVLSLELRGGGGRNLAGYMVVRNGYEGFGEMIFYQVDIESPIKLLGPTAVLEALEKNPSYATLKTLLRNPRVGNMIIYRIGDYDVYFIPVYTAPAGGGVVTEMGTIAAVGATFTGRYNVGLGNSAEEAYRAFLVDLAGGQAVTPSAGVDLAKRMQNVIQRFTEKNLTVVTPTSVSPDLTFQEGNVTYVSEDQRAAAQEMIDSFIGKWAGENRIVLMWSENSKVNFGIMMNIQGITELHYITATLQ